MKKIYSFLAFLMVMLATLFTSSEAKAQLSELEQKTVTVGGAVADFEPNTWYFLHQRRIVNDNKVAHSEVGGLPEGAGFMHDEGEGKQVYTRSIDDVPDNSVATEKAGFLVRFVPSEEHEDAYLMQYGTGNYVTIPSNASNGTRFTSTSSIYDATEMNVYKIQDTDGHFSMNVYPMGVRIDCTGVGYSVPIWGNGENTGLDGNADYSFHEVIFADLSEFDAAMNQLMEILEQYNNYRDSFTIGTEPGQYGEAEVNAFIEALDAADRDYPDLNLDDLTPEQLRQLGQNIIAAYEAVLASHVPYTLADGYYWLKTGQIYTATETDPETMEETEVEVAKYMYTKLNGSTLNARWGSPDDIMTDATFLWKLTNVDGGRVKLWNVGTNSGFNNVNRSTAVTMSTESTAEIVITPAVVIDNVVYVNLNVYPQDASEGRYLHQGEHNNGAGTEGNIVGWYTSYGEGEAHGSEWQFIAVSEEDAQKIIDAYAPYWDREKMLAQYDSIMTHAQQNLEIAQDVQKKVYTDQALITDVSQLSSPCSDSEEGQNLEYLLDGDVETFWHSDWHNEYDGGDHYLQVEMTSEGVENAVMQFTRRNHIWHNITGWAVYGTDDPDALQDGCYHLADLTTPYKNPAETITTDIFPLNGYKYIRFYFTENEGKKYAHFAEFQMYKAEILQSETCQYNVMGELATNLQKIVDELKDVERDDITIENFTALKSAYDAFMQKFVDPAALREAIEKASGVASTLVIGTQPGYWSEGSTGTTLNNTIKDAKAYDEAGNYTPEQSDKYVETLNAQVDNLYASAIGIKEGKWYYLRFAPEEMYDTYGWAKSGANAEINAETGVATTPALFGKYLVVSDAVRNEDNGTEVEEADAEEVGLGQTIHFFTPEISEIQNTDLAKFRFINVGDSAFMMQNKATGMFLKAAGSTGQVTLSAHPTLFDVRAIGYGLNVVAARNLTGSKQNYLHAQLANNVLVTWNAYTPGSNSGLLIEEAENVANDYAGEEFRVRTLDGQMYAYCFPVEISVVDGQMWGIDKIEGTTVTLSKVEKAQPGRPFLYMKGKPENYVADAAADDYDMAVFKHGYELVTEPQATRPLKGTFQSKQVGSGVIVPSGNTLAVSKKSNTSVAANGAYISAEEAYELEAEVVVIYGDSADSVTEVLTKVANGGEVYTLDGRLVSRRGNLNNLSRGIYILNGVKVVIK